MGEIWSSDCAGATHAAMRGGEAKINRRREGSRYDGGDGEDEDGVQEVNGTRRVQVKGVRTMILQ